MHRSTVLTLAIGLAFALALPTCGGDPNQTGGGGTGGIGSGGTTGGGGSAGTGGTTGTAGTTGTGGDWEGIDLDAGEPTSYLQYTLIADAGGGTASAALLRPTSRDCP